MTLTPYSMIDGIMWPAIPPPKSAGLLAMQYQFEQSQWLPLAELERHQFDQAATLLRHALATVPHYRKNTLPSMCPANWIGISGAACPCWKEAKCRRTPNS